MNNHTWATPGGRHWAHLPLFDPHDTVTVREPLGQGPGWWAGAPSVLWDEQERCFYLYYRYRKPRELGRGVECRLARSEDGVNFEDIWQVEKGQIDSPSIEKSSLIRTNEGWHLYLSFVGTDNRWRIERLSAVSPEKFDPSVRFPVLDADMCGAEGVKDPEVYTLAGGYVMLVSYAPKPHKGTDAKAMHGTADIYNTGIVKSHTGLALSVNGTEWCWAGDILSPPDEGWDSYCTRITTMIWREPLWVGLYDGSCGVEQNYEEQAGLCWSADLRSWNRVTRDRPLLAAGEQPAAVRYVSVIPVANRLHYFYEFTRDDGSHELRTSIVGL